MADELTSGCIGVGSRQPLTNVSWMTPLVDDTYKAVTELGRRPRGTDHLQAGAVVKACEYVGLPPEILGSDLLLCEGDGLMNDRFIQALIDAGWSVRVAYIDRPLEGDKPECDRRVVDFAERWSDLVYVLDRDQSVREMALELAGVDPVAYALYGHNLEEA